MNSLPLPRNDGSADLLQSFLEDLTRRGRSKATLATYRWQIDGYLRALGAARIDLQLVSEAWIKDYVRSRKSVGLKTASLYLVIVAIRQFHAFLRRSGRCPRNPARRISPPIPENRIPQVLTLHDVRKLLRALRGGRFRNLRNRAMLSLFYATGIRLKELCGLQESDLDLAACAVHVVGKRGKERTVPFPQGIIDILRRYLDEKNRRFSDMPHVFVSFRGRPISRSGIWGEIKNLARRAGVSKPVSPVILRHTFATHLMWGGADLRSIQTLLGHRELSTTAIYTQLDDGHIQKTYVQAHPMANGQLEARVQRRACR